MIKSFSFGIGIFLLVIGLCLHAIDSYTVRSSATAQATGAWPGAKTILSEPWRPWVYLGAGTILILWTCTLPKKMAGK